MKLYSKYINNEITLDEYIKLENYKHYELPTSECNRLIKKIKKDIKSGHRPENINISLEITDKDVYVLRLTENYVLKYKLKITLKEILEKEKIMVFGETYYLLGEGVDGDKYYLRKATFDCAWYWAGGYIDVFNNTKTDVICHTHYDSGNINNHKFANSDSFDKAFKITTLTEKETRKFHEFMQTFYIARKAMSLSYVGGVCVTTNPLSEVIKNKYVYNHFNKIIEAVNEELDKLLSPLVLMDKEVN